MSAQPHPPAQQPPRQKRLWWWPGAEMMVFCVAFLIFIFGMPQMLNLDGDLGRHLTIGNYVLDHGSFPETDIFSHTMQGETLYPHSWLSEVCFALAFRVAGLNGVGWLTALVLASSYALLTYGLRLFGVRTYVRLGLGLLAFASGVLHAVTRPHIFTLLFFTIFLLILESERQRPNWKKLAWLPVLMVVWANLHGAFISGLVLVGLYAAGYLLKGQYRRSLTLLALLAILLLAAAITPGGFAQIGHSFEYLGEDYLIQITSEYNSPDFHRTVTWPFAGLLFLAILLGWRNQRQLDWPALVLLIIWGAFGLYSARNIPLAGQVFVLMLAGQVEVWISDVSPGISGFLSRSDQIGRRSWGWMWAAGLVGMIMLIQNAGIPLDFYYQGNHFNPEVFPIAAVDAIEAAPPQGKMFNEFAWGGYLLHRLWPEKLVFMDAQTDFYGEALTREQIQVADALPGWEQVLERYQIDWIILPRSRPVAAWLDVSPQWQSIYRDATAIIWVRVAP